MSSLTYLFIYEIIMWEESPYYCANFVVFTMLPITMALQDANFGIMKKGKNFVIEEDKLQLSKHVFHISQDSIVGNE